MWLPMKLLLLLRQILPKNAGLLFCHRFRRLCRHSEQQSDQCRHSSIDDRLRVNDDTYSVGYYRLHACIWCNRPDYRIYGAAYRIQKVFNTCPQRVLAGNGNMYFCME